MGFPLEVVVAGKHDNTCRSHIKYVDNMDLKTKTDDLDGKKSKSYAVLKKTALKTDFEYESYPLLKKNINDNQRAMWQVEVGLCCDAPPYPTFSISSLLNK